MLTALNGKQILCLLSKIVQSYLIDGHLFSLHNLKKTFEHLRFNMWWCHTASIITINSITGIQPCLLRCFLQTVMQPVTDTAAKSQDDKGLLLKSEANTQKDGGWVREGTGGETPGGRLQRWQTVEWNWRFINSP